MNKEFQMKENGFAEIQKSAILRSIPLAIVAIGTALAIFYFNTEAQTSEVNVLPFIIPIIIGVLAFGVSQGIKRQKSLYESYQLKINENEIVREQINTPTVSILHNQIKCITRSRKGALTIVGNSSTEIIIVPSQINNPEELEKTLSDIHPITAMVKKPLIERLKWVQVLLIIGFMSTVFISKNKIIVGICGTILVLFLVYSFIGIRRNKNVDKKTKNGMWWIVLVVFAVIANMYLKLFDLL